MGRLSNPLLVAGQDRADPVDVTAEPHVSAPARRPVQRRLAEPGIDRLIVGYESGRSLAELATEFGIHHRTVAAHLERRSVPRRMKHRKMSRVDVEQAIRRYQAGDSLATLGIAFNVDPATVGHELQRARVKIRPRPGR